jgi:L-alanine-DL-glutamate epimerase-like enolase superfamily enzyme
MAKLIRSTRVFQLSFPLRRPFDHARGRREATDNLLLLLDLGGHFGTGECTPRLYLTGETTATVSAAISALDWDSVESALDMSSFEAAVRSVERLSLPARLGTPEVPALAGACLVELALLDAIGRHFARPLRDAAAALSLPAALLATEPTEYVPVRSLDLCRSVEEFVTDVRRRPHAHVKIKAGRNGEEDKRRIRVVREALGEGVSISVDANMAWTRRAAAEMIEDLRAVNIAWFEEPLPRGSLADYRALRAETGARIMFDESLCTFEDGRRSEGACDLFNIRISKCGGLLPSFRLAELAHRRGIGFQLGANVGQTAILGAAGRQFAAALSGLSALEAAMDSAPAVNIVFEHLDPHPQTGLCPPLTGPGLGVTLRRQAL